jgi:hypothetical protein
MTYERGLGVVAVPEEQACVAVARDQLLFAVQALAQAQERAVTHLHSDGHRIDR